MSVRIPNTQRIRAQLDNFQLKGVLNNALTDAAAIFARGSKLRFEFALFYGEEIADPSQITTARLRILAGSDPDDAVAMDKTIGIDQMNLGITAGQWVAGEQNHCHLAFEFLAAETAESVFGALADESTHWFQLTYGPDDTTWFCGTLKSIDPGYDAPGNAPPAAGQSVTRDEVAAMLAAFAQSFVKFKGNPAGATIQLTAPSSGKIGEIGIDDDGNWIQPNQVTT